MRMHLVYQYNCSCRKSHCAVCISSCSVLLLLRLGGICFRNGLHPRPFVHVQPSDFPVGFSQHFRIGLDEGIARKDWILALLEELGLCRAVRKVAIACDCSTECKVEHKAHVLQMISRTTRALTDSEISVRKAPTRWDQGPHASICLGC